MKKQTYCTRLPSPSFSDILVQDDGKTDCPRGCWNTRLSLAEKDMSPREGSPYTDLWMDGCH